MAILSVVLGVILIIGGVSIMFTPLSSFLGMGYFIIILFFISGIFGLVRGISKKQYGLDFWTSIVALILGVIGLFMPGDASLATDQIILFLAAGWFVVHGTVSIFGAIKLKRVGASGGAVALGIILGVLEVFLGLYSCFHPLLLAIAIGWLIGIFFIETGLSMMVLGTALSGDKSATEQG